MACVLFNCVSISCLVLFVRFLKFLTQFDDCMFPSKIKVSVGLEPVMLFTSLEYLPCYVSVRLLLG